MRHESSLPRRYGDNGRTSAGAGLPDGQGGIAAACSRQRIFCRPRLDWTERRPHLSGTVGAILAQRCFDLKWLQRHAGVLAGAEVARLTRSDISASKFRQRVRMRSENSGSGALSAASASLLINERRRSRQPARGRRRRHQSA